MHYSYAMITSRITPPVDEEGANVEGAEEVGGVAISVYGRFGRSWASLRLIVAMSMANIIEK